MLILLFGPPGAGKGTQAQALGDRLGIPHLASGEIFRAEVKGGTELGRRAKDYMDRGVLVPDEITSAMVREHIARAAAKRAILLDGYPRTLEQARAFDAMLTELGLPLGRVVNIAVDEAWLIERLTGRWTCWECGAIYHERNKPPRKAGVCEVCGGALYQRTDDRAEVVRTRLDVYRAQTEPVMRYYRERGALVDIDGARAPGDVTDDILAALPAGIGTTKG